MQQNEFETLSYQYARKCNIGTQISKQMTSLNEYDQLVPQNCSWNSADNKMQPRKSNLKQICKTSQQAT